MNLNINKEINSDDIINMEGNLYCIHNKMYNLYGENVFKLGKSSNFNNRKLSYVTPYIEPCKIIYLSEKIRNYNLAENVLFEILKEHRITNTREFFKCEEQIIIKTINDICQIFFKYTDNEIENMYLLNKNLENKVSKIDIILSTPDITKEEYEQALENQKKDNTNEEEINKVNKYIYKKALGIDFLNNDEGEAINGKKFIKTFDLNSINNFVSLIDTSNIKDYTDNQTKEYKDKAELINKLIVDLGFTNIFDTKQILKTDFETKMNEALKNNVLFTNQQNTQIRFNLNNKNKIDSVKGFLGFVNSLFESYNIKLSYGRIRVKGQKEKVACYNLEILNDINELIEYKIRKGFKLIDTKNIRLKPKTETYKHLIDWDKLKQHE